MIKPQDSVWSPYGRGRLAAYITRSQPLWLWLWPDPSPQVQKSPVLLTPTEPHPGHLQVLFSVEMAHSCWPHFPQPSCVYLEIISFPPVYIFHRGNNSFSFLIGPFSSNRSGHQGSILDLAWPSLCDSEAGYSSLWITQDFCLFSFLLLLFTCEEILLLRIISLSVWEEY